MNYLLPCCDKNSIKDIKNDIENDNKETKLIIYEPLHPRKNISLTLISTYEHFDAAYLQLQRRIDQAELFPEKFSHYQIQTLYQMSKYFFKYLQNYFQTKSIIFMKAWDSISSEFSHNCNKYESSFKLTKSLYIRDHELKFYILSVNRMGFDGSYRDIGLDKTDIITVLKSIVNKTLLYDSALSSMSYQSIFNYNFDITSFLNQYQPKTYFPDYSSEKIIDFEKKLKSRLLNEKEIEKDGEISFPKKEIVKNENYRFNNRENRDGRDFRDFRDFRENRDMRDNRDVRENREIRDYRGIRDIRESRESRDMRDNTRDPRQRQYVEKEENLPEEKIIIASESDHLRESRENRQSREVYISNFTNQAPIRNQYNSEKPSLQREREFSRKKRNETSSKESSSSSKNSSSSEASNKYKSTKNRNEKRVTFNSAHTKKKVNRERSSSSSKSSSSSTINDNIDSKSNSSSSVSSKYNNSRYIKSNKIRRKERSSSSDSKQDNVKIMFQTGAPRGYKRNRSRSKSQRRKLDNNRPDHKKHRNTRKSTSSSSSSSEKKSNYVEFKKDRDPRKRNPAVKIERNPPHRRKEESDSD